MCSEVNIVNSVVSRGSQSYGVAAKGFADPKLASMELNLAALLYFAHVVYGVVLDRRQLLWKTSRARLKATGRHLHVQRFMRP